MAAHDRHSMIEGQELRHLFAETVDAIAGGSTSVREIEDRLRTAGMPQALARRFISMAKDVALMFRACERS